MTRYNGTSSNDTINGSALDDSMFGGDGADVLNGLAGNDTLDGGIGNDTMVGGTGNDTYVVDAVGDVVTENASEGTDTVRAGISYSLGNNIENLTLTGALNINATGNALNNILTGNIGNNILDGGAGADTMIGGTGNDTYIVDNAGDVVTESGSTGTDLVQASVSYTLAANVENLLLTGSANINGTGNTLANYLTGNSGNNVLDGGAANDTIDGGLGNDTMIGGLGNDTFIVNSASDMVTEAAGGGIDTIQTSISYTASANVENLTLLGSSNINATGNTLANMLTGNSGDNILDGGTGNDTMAGGAGNDTYVVDAAGDVVTEAANAGIDTVQSAVTYVLGNNVENLTLIGSGNLNGTGNTLANTLTGNSGNNLLNGLTGADTMAGGAGNDTYVVDNAGDVVTEGAGAGTDLIQSSVTYTLSANVENLTLTGSGIINATGNDLNNVLTGNTGDNLLDGGLGADTMIGGTGQDIYIVDNAGDVVTELAGGGSDTVRASISYTLGTNLENLTLTGGANINATGNTVANIIYGNSGNNVIDGGAGADGMTGGDGNDSYVVDNAGDVVTEYIGGGTDLVTSSLAYTLGLNLENLTLTGSANINGTGNELDNIIIGNSGNNVLNGMAGADAMAGGAGNDTYVVDNAGDTVTENAAEGTDLVQSSVTFALSANVENLTLTGTRAIDATGNALNNVIIGNAGANSIDGGAGADSMTGGDGNDTYVVDNAGDIVTEASGGASGIDLVRSSITYTLTANVENLTLTGSANIDGTGNGLDNILTGNDGNNVLDAGAGADTLDGGLGADTMRGGIGDDIYIVDNIGDVITENVGAGTDLVRASVSYTLIANVENIRLMGGADIDATGNSLNNVLTGNSGNNVLDGGIGADTMAGGIGNDTYVVDNIGDVVQESFNSGVDLVRSSITYTLGANLENLTLTGTGDINGTGNAVANEIIGNSGDNILDGLAGADTMTGGDGYDTYIVDNIGDVVVENANEGIDEVRASVTYTLSADVENLTLTGTANIDGTGNDLDNIITGNSGNNTLDGGLGADTMIGGAGNDTYIVDDTNDVVTELAGEGIDLVLSSASYTLGDEVENLTLTGTDNIDGTGNALDNLIIGNDGNNILDGSVGADTMIGGLGDDTYIVDDASDVVTELAGEGTDEVRANFTYTLGANIENLTLTGTDNIDGTGNALDNIITGNSGNNILDGAAGADTLAGGDGNDTYIVDDAGDVVNENAGEGTDEVQASVTYTLGAEIENLTLTGSANIDGTGNDLDNVLTGNSGNNTLDGGLGVDTLVGGDGNDVYVVDDSGDTITEIAGEGVDEVQASASFTLGDEVENLTLTGSADIDGTGNVLDNLITGNGGNNALDGGAGADTLIGGLGNDTYFVDNVGDVVTENASEGTDRVISSIDYTLSSEIENLTLAGDHDLSGAGNALDNEILGNIGNNLIDGGAGADTMAGGDGNDIYIVDNIGDTITENASEGHDLVRASVTYTLSAEVEDLTLTGTDNLDGTGNASDNVLTGNSGNNMLDGVSGNDILIGGAGNDIYAVHGAGDVVIELASEGTDLVNADVSYTLTANVENLVLTGTGDINGTGNEMDNLITGNDGNNILDGDSGADTMVGGLGNDIYIVDANGDVVTENNGEGTDEVQTSISYTLGADVENLTLTGAAFIDGTGNALANVITGNSGNNILDGVSGADTLTGGGGADMFMFHNPSAFADLQTITDFSTAEGDSLNIHELMLASSFDPQVMDINDFISITESGSDSIISIDLDGLGTAYGWVDIATLQGVTGLASVGVLVDGDIIVI